MDNSKITQLRDILKFYSRHPKVTETLQQLKGADDKVYLNGLQGSSKSFIAGEIISNSKQAHLFIFQDKEDAAYFHNDISNILEQKLLFSQLLINVRLFIEKKIVQTYCSVLKH